MADALPTLTEIAAACREMGLATSAPELHGGLCGWLAGGGEPAPDWLAKVLVDTDLPPPAPDGALERLRRATAMQLDDRSFGFALLLPGSEATLAVRSGALFEWCRGFVGGFGLGAGADPPLSEEGREALHDLVRLAAATAQDDGDDEDEAALAEIEEFVRVAVLLLHGDCTLGPRHRGRLN
ncbi:YecA family protein [soil metagenome]